MDQLLKRLEDWGCDVPSALNRLLNDEDLLIDCIRQVAQDPAFEALGENLKKGDAKNAFEAAHSLKGIIANTSITPLYGIIVEMVEVLRKDRVDNLEPAYEQLIAKQKELQAILGQL